MTGRHATVPRLGLRAAARTDVGHRRTENEDAFGVFPELGLFVVADGIGGHAGGKIASAMSVDVIRRSVRRTRESDLTPMVDGRGSLSLVGRRLEIALGDANERILAAGRDNPALKRMGAAVAAVLLDAATGSLAIGHAGDARVYRIRGSAIEQLTEDHTVVQALIKAGKLRPEELASAPNRHMLTRAVGVEAVLQPDVAVERLAPGDVFVLTSDGIHDLVMADDILSVVRETPGDLIATCDRLVVLANSRGGHDNSTAIALECVAEQDDPTVQL